MSDTLSLGLQLAALVVGAAVVLGIAALVLTHLEKGMQRSLTEKQPKVRR